MSPYHSATTLLSSYLRLQLSQELAVHGPQDASAQRALQVRLVGEVPVDDRLRGARGGGDVLHRHVGATGVDQVPSHEIGRASCRESVRVLLVAYSVVSSGMGFVKPRDCANIRFSS